MVFSSAIFLFFFFPLVFLLYYLLPNIRLRNILLVISSLLFYAFGEFIYVFLMIASIILNYIFGLLVAKPHHAKLMLVIAVCINLGILVIFKYTDFFISNFNSLFSLNIPLPNIRLPIGISFFTFQALSYVIDVYRDPAYCQHNLGKLMLYISFFPQLIAGPIVKYDDIAQQIDNRQISMSDIAEGMKRFIFGLSKKLLISNTVGYAADALFAVNGGNFISAWSGALFYCIQIYYDFSGYSDMAIGLGRMFGFHFKENFEHPYNAVSIQDFWRKWHISLSSWFKSYLYIPLGGNRLGKFRTIINKYIVFFFTGLWHGASWNFVLWGLIHGTFLALESTILRPVSRHKVIGRIYTLFIVSIAFVLFRAETLYSGLIYLSNMFTNFTLTGGDMASFLALLTPYTLAMTFLGIVFAFPVRQKLEKISGRYSDTGSYAFAAMLLVLCILNLSSATFNPFIYFRF